MFILLYKARRPFPDAKRGIRLRKYIERIRVLVLPILLLVSCNSPQWSPGNPSGGTTDPNGQTAPPAEVRNLTIDHDLDRLIVKWTLPQDDLYDGVEISFVPADIRPVRVPKNVSEITVTGLKSRTEYTITIRSISSAGRYSAGVSMKATPGEEMIFVTAGSSFSPVLTIEGRASILWTWADGTTSDSAAPAKNFGSRAERSTRLKVVPWSAVRRINIGYDGSDGGVLGTENHVPDQEVVSVLGLENAAPYLREWCSSYNRLTRLDFTGFVKLETIECYSSISLKEIVLRNTPSLRRLCVESCRLTGLDIGESPMLEDLRGASNGLTALTFEGVYPHLKHVCVRDNPLPPDLFSNTAAFPSVEELWIWNSGQSGRLGISSMGTDSALSVLASENAYAVADFRGSFVNPDLVSRIELNDNRLSSILLDGCSQVVWLEARNNLLDPSAVDSILRTLDELGRSNGHIDLRGNSQPGQNGRRDATNLERKGWVVLTGP